MAESRPFWILDGTQFLWLPWFPEKGGIKLWDTLFILKQRSGLHKGRDIVFKSTICESAFLLHGVRSINDTTCLDLQSCAYYFGWSLFQESEETIHSAEINDTSYERAACFHREEEKKKFEKKNSKWSTQKNLIFQLRQFSIFSQQAHAPPPAFEC